MRRSSLLASLLAAAALPAQTVHVVQGGPQAFETTVQITTPGDVLLVRPGSYNGTLIDKGLTIRCDPGATFVQFGIQVANIPVGQEFSMSGGQIDEAAAFTGLFTQARDCRGPVLFDDVVFGSLLVEILLSDAVHLTRSTFRPCTVRFRRSQATLSGCRTDPAARGGQQRGSLQVGASGIALHDCLIDGDASTRLRAGPGAVNVVPAILAAAGSLRIAPGVTLEGANGPASGGSVTPDWVPLPASAIDNAIAGETLTATLRAAPGSTSVLLLSLLTAPVNVPGIGLVWSAPGSAVLLGGTVPASGRLSTSLPVPATALRAALLTQPASLTTAGIALVGPPTAFVVH